MDKLRARKRNKAAAAVTMLSSAANVASGKGVRWHFDKVRVATGNTVAHLLAPKWPRREYIVSFAWQTPSGNSTAIIEDLSCLCPLNFFSFYEEDALLHFVPARGKEKWLLLCHTTKHCCTIHLYRHAPLCSVLNFAPTSEGGSFTNSTLLGYVHHDM